MGSVGSVGSVRWRDGGEDVRVTRDLIPARNAGVPSAWNVNVNLHAKSGPTNLSEYNIDK